MRDWVYALRINQGHPPSLPECPEERRWIVHDLVEEYGWSLSAALAACGVHTSYRLEVAA